VLDIRYVTPLIKLLKTTTFKLAAIYLLVFAVSAAAILSYVYWSTAGLLVRQTDATIEAEITGLEEQYRQGGLNNLIKTIRQRARKDSANVYLLTDFRGRPLAGNLAALPPGTGKGTGWVNFPYSIEGVKGKSVHGARARFFTLRGQFHLVVGRDIEEQQAFVSVIRGALFWSLGLVLLLGLAGGLLMMKGQVDMVIVGTDGQHLGLVLVEGAVPLLPERAVQRAWACVRDTGQRRLPAKIKIVRFDHPAQAYQPRRVVESAPCEPTTSNSNWSTSIRGSSSSTSRRAS